MGVQENRPEWELAREIVLKKYPKAFYGRVSCRLYSSRVIDEGVEIGKGVTPEEAYIDANWRLLQPPSMNTKTEEEIHG